MSPVAGSSSSKKPNASVILQKVKELGTSKKGLVTDEEFKSIAGEVCGVASAESR